MIKKPKNENYSAVVTEIKNIVSIDNCDNVVHAVIFGQLVIVSKDTEVGSKVLYFPLECQLSKEFLHNNNLYRKGDLNKNTDKKGFFEENGRVRCVKFRGNASQGFCIPLDSLEFTGFDLSLLENDMCFDELNDIEICKKYIVRVRNQQCSGNKGKKPKNKVSCLVDNQFRLHYDTSQLYKNVHKLKSSDIISVTKKLHGTSVVISKVLCNKKLNPFYRLLRFIGIPIVDKEYKNIYSSRKVIKNDCELESSYYKTDIWGKANDRIKEFLSDGMTIYAEIVGYAENSQIQKDYDYGCKVGEFNVYIYRITQTNLSGDVFEFSANQVQEWCNMRGLFAVPELYYGRAKHMYDYVSANDNWNENFLEELKKHFLETEELMCINEVPTEGIVLRVESLDASSNTYKLKSDAFYQRETKLLDKGEISIEDEN